MFSQSTPEQTELTAIQKGLRQSGNLASRKIWLPKLLYDCLPVFYLLSGVAALLATLYISHWLWILPHYLLFSAACLHLAYRVFRRRQKHSSDESNVTDGGSPAA